MAFSTALSGLTAASSDLDVTANNIANADTIGFKESRAQFADVYAAGAVNLNNSVIGQGVRLSSTAQQFTQGNISTSSSNLDLAISGDGFYTLKDASGYVYSRNGQFGEDKSGNVISSTGQALQVYPPLINGGFNTGTLSNLNLQTAQSAPLATTTGTVILNLPANTAPPTVAPFNSTNSQTYNESTSTTVYDSLGNAYPATMYFSALAAAPAATPPIPPNTWAVNMTVNGVSAGAAQNITFGSTGAVTSPVGGVLNFNGFAPANGAQPMTLAFNFGQTTQYGGQFGVTSITQNGYATGQLSTVAIDPTGIVSAVYTNGRSTQLGQLALANFPNPQGLKELGNTNWSETFSSGTVVAGVAGSAGFGSIQSGALESSNVDLTTQLVDMITAQRAFQANAQVITTANAESQTIINIH
ncbi:MAG: flagellar biosynthesis protein FlgE [Gammaproteobacteria bacterium]|nr:flagellar biosynthesis protein FlgE [Gammaproteobacteria bacterium]